MACEICGRNGCVASFHSFEEQERHEAKMQLVDQIEQCPDCDAWYIDHDGFGFCGCKEHERIDAEQKARIEQLSEQLHELAQAVFEQGHDSSCDYGQYGCGCAYRLAEEALKGIADDE